uniref:Uncharacterized protein n=1 Tax=Sphaerodactylus townsendi TaxID=933632 RepID=A0ACB8FUM5_9SAUR
MTEYLDYTHTHKWDICRFPPSPFPTVATYSQFVAPSPGTGKCLPASILHCITTAQLLPPTFCCCFLPFPSAIAYIFKKLHGCVGLLSSPTMTTIILQNTAQHF